MRVSVDPGWSAFLRRLEPGEFVRWTEGAAICFPNRDEAAVLTGETDPARMAISLSAHYGAVAVKLAADGAVLAARGSGRAGRHRHPPKRFPALPAVVRDTTGAGDAFSRLPGRMAGRGRTGRRDEPRPPRRPRWRWPPSVAAPAGPVCESLSSPGACRGDAQGDAVVIVVPLRGLAHPLDE